MNQPNHGQPNFAAYQQGSAYDNMNLSPQPGDTIFADLNTDDVGSPLFAAAGGDTNNNNAMDALTAAAVAAKPATPQGGPQQIFSNNTQPKAGNSTPLGKVVETGQEHTGRWTKEEHDAFLTALQLYGKEWKKVAARVKTRTVVQTRTHAQKYFQKLQRVMEVSLCQCVVVILFALIDCCEYHAASFCRKLFHGGNTLCAMFLKPILLPIVLQLSARGRCRRRSWGGWIWNHIRQLYVHSSEQRKFSSHDRFGDGSK